MSNDVGERIKSYRQRRELSLADLAQRTGLDQAFLATVEDGLYPSLGPLVKIARALGCRLARSWTTR